MKNLRILFVPEMRCLRCGQLGYVDAIMGLCCGCLNISMQRYRRRKLEAERTCRIMAKAMEVAVDHFALPSVFNLFKSKEKPKC